MRLEIIFNKWNRLILFFFFLLMPAGSLLGLDSSTNTQNASALTSQNTGALQDLIARCSAPGGAQLPACQAAAAAAASSPAGNVAPQTAAPATAEPSGQMAEVEEKPLPAEPPTEFQRFVAVSQGEILPIFGTNFFAQAPSTFSPLDRVPVTDNYVIGPDDEILLRVWGQVSLDLALTVDRGGAIYIPQVGSVNVAGLQFQQLSGFLRAQMNRVYRNYELNVNMGRLRSIQIFVVGQSRRPGAYTISSLSTLVNALFVSGGPTGQGSLRHIQLKRGAEVVVEFDLYDLLLHGDKSKDARLLPGDVVYIPPAGPQAAIAGSVRNPAIYELKNERTAGQLIEMAGGLSAIADGQRATLERVKERKVREALDISMDQAGLSTPVQDGDLLRIFSIVPRFANAVTLRGNVANPGRFAWHTGMRLKDIIPDKESLLTRDYWRKRNLLGRMPAEEKLTPTIQDSSSIYEKPASGAVPVHVEGEESDLPGQSAWLAAQGQEAEKTQLVQVGRLAAEINWSYAVIERRNPQNLSTKLIPFNLGKLVIEGDESQNLPLEPGDVVTILSQADLQVPVLQQTRTMRLEGEFNMAGAYNVLPGETLGQLIQRVGGLTPQAYLYGAEFTRESTRRDQQQRLDQFLDQLEAEISRTGSSHLASATTAEDAASMQESLQSERQFIQRLRALRSTGRIVLNLDPNSNDISQLMGLPLEDGDRFVVPPKMSTVNVLGAVYNQNAFLHDPQRNVRDYLHAAGGYTRNADKGRTYIIRADGTVVPKGQNDGLFKKSFDSAKLYAGDSIVVPEQILKTPIMRAIRDWAYIFGQFGLGIAAIHSL